MTLESFRESPWLHSHKAYRESTLSMFPAPEYASSEVLLSSLYRFIGLDEISDRVVPQKGRDLERELQKARNRGQRPADAALDADAFISLLHSILESPKLANQSAKRFLQITPIVPYASAFSGSARLTANSWVPGALVRRMICLGAKDREELEQIWSLLFRALSIEEDDDIFAKFLESEFKAWISPPDWSLAFQKDCVMLVEEDRKKLRSPARQFVEDLPALVAAKSAMTRRQWTSLLDSLMRLAAVSHVAWVCEIHARIWKDCIRPALWGAGANSAEEVRSLMFPQGFKYLTYGDRALPGIKDRVSAFLTARISLNATLWALEDIGIPVTTDLSSANDVYLLSNLIRENRTRLEGMRIEELIAEVQEKEARALLCQKGIGSNIMEFARHVLGQRNSASSILRGYDQGYILRQRSSAANSPWIVGLGPVAALVIVHCSLAGMSGPRSVHRLSQHLSSYGISVDHRDISQNDLGNQLRMLGLVLDSPDAESGMLLVPPFARQATKGSAIA